MTAIAATHGYVGTDLVDVTDDLSCLDSAGVWFVVGFFERAPLALRFSSWQQGSVPATAWHGAHTWTSDTTRSEYIQKVEFARARIAAGDVYQVNVCRKLSSPWNVRNEDVVGLHALLEQLNPAPMSSLLSVQDSRLGKYDLEEIQIASASPEIFLQRRGEMLTSSPIKGTAAPNEDFLEKDISENVMIVDLVRNDLSQVCEVATIEVPRLLTHEAHPGLKHLVSTVAGRLDPSVGWEQIFSATFPPGSVTGAPKSSALKIINEIEAPRDVYCGALGVVNADEKTADLAVAIRTFWKQDDKLWFGAGAGITWGSDAELEWEETELKARHLLAVASTDRSGQ